MASGKKRMPRQEPPALPPQGAGHPNLPSVDDAIDVVRAYMRYRRWSRWRVAKESGLHDTTLRDLYKPSWKPTVPVLRILYALIPKDFDPAKAPPPKPEKAECPDARRP
jgi:hypothetical protein